jgi:hypothetical protein
MVRCESEYYQDHREHKLLQAKIRFKEHKEEIMKKRAERKDAINEYQRKYWKNVQRLKPYNITKEDYDSMLELQDNRCAICNEKFKPFKEPSIDHNHETKKIRGLLCNKCNFMIGLSGDSILILEKAIEYLGKDSNDYLKVLLS